jgi:hypothetical protein
MSVYNKSCKKHFKLHSLLYKESWIYYNSVCIFVRAYDSIQIIFSLWMNFRRTFTEGHMKIVVRNISDY